MDQTTLKILPGYKALAEQVENQKVEITKLVTAVKEDDKKINTLIAQQKATNVLLKEAVDVLKCKKSLDIKHRSKGSWITILMVSFALVALIAEVATKGEWPFFSVAWPYIKGVFI